MKKIILIAIAVLVAFGCKKEEHPPLYLDGPGCDNGKSIMFARVFDANGGNLLNPENPKMLNDIKLFKTVNGVEFIIYGKNVINKQGCTILEPISKSVSIPLQNIRKDWSIGLELPRDTEILGEIIHDTASNYDFQMLTRSVRIQWDEQNSDVIKAQYYQYYPHGSTFIMRVWVDDVELERANNSEYFVFDKIIK